ncbi:MAG: ComF family protein [Phycisphaeraceae bacterium]
MSISAKQVVRTWWAAMAEALLEDCETSGDIAAKQAMWRADEADAYCGRCGASAGEGAATESGCPHCRGQSVAWDGVVRLDAYESPMDEWIRRMKFRRMWTWGPWFGRQLAMASGGRLRGGRTVVTGVPLHWRRRWSRGYDQAWLMAKAMGEAGGVPVSRLLERRRWTTSQSKLKSQHKRAANVKDAFAMKPVDLTGWTVWLVDDVKTTGSTLRQCVRLLKNAGAERVFVAVAAVADPKGSGFERS